MKLIKSKKYNNVYSYTTKKGTLYAIRFVYYDLNSVRREKQQRGFKTELLARKAELALEVKYADNNIQQIMDSSMTIAEWIPRFVQMRSRNWRPNTRSSYNNCFKNYIIPLLGNQSLDKMTRFKYERLFIDPLLNRLSPATVRNYHHTVMTLFNAAVENDILMKNKLKGIKLPVPENRRAFEKEDLVRFNKQLPTLKPEFHTIFALLELTGMRVGEALGLTWDDIDFTKKLISINKTRGTLGTGPTKTASGNRTISVTDTLLNLLKNYRLTQRKQCFRLGLKFENKHLVFTSSEHNVPASTGTVRNNFNKALRQAGIDENKYVVHGLRHTHATYLLNSGMNPADVAKRLGHANASVTLSTYTHSLDGNDSILALQIDNIVNL